MRFDVSIALQRAAMQRPPLPSTIRFCRAVLTLTVCFGVSSWVSSAQADEFSIIPKGDAVYGQLSSLAQPGDAKLGTSLTRYEAALQTARFILDLQNRDTTLISRSNWRALKALTVSLKSELRQLGVDVDGTLALADQNLQPSAAEDLSLPASVRKSATASGSTKGTPGTGFMLGQPALNKPGVKASDIEVPLTQHLHASSALVSAQHNSTNPFDSTLNTRGASTLASKANDSALASQNKLAYDFNPALTLRAGTSKVSTGTDASSLLTAPFFAGANGVSAAGGGLDLNVGAGFKLSTEIERLRANTGAQASRIGGGASLSAFQNRFSMNMSLSRLLPEDEAQTPATSAQFGMGLDVTHRLSLSLLYQGLFAESANNNDSRVSGGFSLNF